jgi:hypothetical protein
MTRSVLLPIAGDPFLFRYWLRFYDKNIAPHVDQLCVGQYGDTHPDYLTIIKDLCDERGIVYSSSGDSSSHHASLSLDVAYSQMKDDDGALMLIESDCFVFDGSIIEKYFSYMQNQSLVGSTRPAWADMTPDSLVESNYHCTDGMWPCFLFVRKALFGHVYDMLTADTKTSGVDPTTSVLGSYRSNEEFAIFGAFLWELAKDKADIVQMRGDLNNINSPKEWIHFGRLEQLSIRTGILRHPDNVPIILPPGTGITEDRTWQPLEELQHARGLEANVLGMYRACVNSSQDHPLLQKHADNFLTALDRVIDTFGQDVTEVDHWHNHFVGWIQEN